ncbi:MAG: hypothetical protein IIZ49_06935, partial [Oscillospiraceae bacterium]|nr:hypothetical protein [Oscillospiraceae bacterium]
MKKANRILALVLCAVLMLSLFAGCNKQGDGSGTDAKDSSSASSTTDNKNPTNGNGGQNSGSNTSASEFVYRPTYTPFPETVNWIQSTVLSKDKLFFVTEEVTGAQRTFYDEEWNQLGQIEIDPSEVEYGGGPDGPIEVYEEFEGAISSSFATATTTDTAEGEDEETGSGDEDVTPPADDKPTDEQGRKYCEELDLWYTYASDNEVYSQVVYSMNLDGTNAQKLPDFHPMTIPEGSQGNSYIESMTVDPDGNLWVSESGSTYHYDENQEYIWDGEMSSIRKLTATGAEDFTLDVSKIKAEQEYAYFSNLVFDKDGNLYLRESNSNTLYVFDKTGAQTKKIELGETYINNLFLIDGQLYGLYWSETGGQTLAPFDPQKGSFGEGISVPNNVYQIFPGGGDYDFYYNNGSEMCGFNAVTGESTTLLNWIDSDINADQLNQLFVTDAGEIYATSNNYESSSGSGWELAKFTKVPASEVPVKTVLNLACVFLDYNLRSAIINFNKTNDTYRIHVSDYSQFNTEDDWNAGVTKLSTEIISGIVPDI